MVTAILTLIALAPVGDEWQNNQKLGLGKEPVRAAFSSFSTLEGALKILPQHSDRTVSLDSETDWVFNWAPTPDKKGTGEWALIKVPCSWQAMGAGKNGGWGTPLYTNITYPFQPDAPGGSRVMLDPPGQYTSFAERNPVGIYRRNFTIERKNAKDRYFLKFDGVDSFFYLWVNGRYMGFSKDSRTPAEFDVTSIVHSGVNSVRLEVYRYSDGSYLEDQDMFRLSGIFRHVWLISRPKDRIRDFFLTAAPAKEGDYSGDWILNAEVEGDVELSLYTWDDELVGRTTDKTLVVESPRLWSAEEPNCYKVVLSNGSEFVSAVFGFRVSEIRDGRYFLNGRKIKLKGANLHESDPMYGHFVPDSRREQDVEMLKAANCNTVRCSHYPQDDYFYYLANTRGLYVVDEANVETHGYGYGENSLSHRPEWRDATVARNLAMVERNKNHPCVVIWSYGNEAGPGENFAAARDAIKARDTTRPTHYERDWSVADMDGCQYPAVDWVWQKAAASSSPKPFYISEYAHNMGNAMGNLKDYQDAIESSDVILGATIWDWVDQGLWKKTGDGDKKILAFGGEFGDKPNDGMFCMNGCVLSNRTPEPGYSEIAHVFQNWSVTPGENHATFTVRNKNYFVDSRNVTCSWTAYRGGEPFARGNVNLAEGGPVRDPHIKPQTGRTFNMPPRVLSVWRDYGGVCAIRFKFTENGRQIASDQIDFPVERRLFDGDAGEVAAETTAGGAVLKAQGTSVTISAATGLPSSVYRKDAAGMRELLASPMKLDAFRSPVSNEEYFKKMWLALGLDDLKATDCQLGAIETGEDGSKSVLSKAVWQGNEKARLKFAVAAKWTMHANGELVCAVKIRPLGPKAEIPRIGLAWSQKRDDADLVQWFGRGPFENYPDRKSGAFIGRWQLTPAEFFFPYSRTEDCGNREDVYGFRFVNGITVRTLGEQFSLSVNPWTAAQLMACVHAEELPQSEATQVGIFAAVRGLGGASCGPAPIERDIVRTDRDFDMIFTLSVNDERLDPRELPAEGVMTALDALLPERAAAIADKISMCSSREPDHGEPDHLIDGDLDTIWHSQYGTTMGNFPHVIAVELAAPKKMKGLKVWQRQIGVNGMLKDVKLEISANGETWRDMGVYTLATTRDEQDIVFPVAVEGVKFYRLTALNNHAGNDYAALAEAEIIEE